MSIFVKNEDGGVTISPILESPTVYLDYCIIVDLAGTPTGNQFRDKICNKGTLYLSWAHLIELLGPGPTRDKVKAYLKSFGDRFIVIDPDPNEVVKRESEWTPKSQNPALDMGLLAIIAAKWSISSEQASFGVLLDYMDSEPNYVDQRRTMLQGYQPKTKAIFHIERNRYQTDKVAKKMLDEIEYAHVPPFVTNKVSLELTRECVRTHEQFNPSDALDFNHAVVSISYCDVVVLDKKWASPQFSQAMRIRDFSIGSKAKAKLPGNAG